MNNLDNTKKNIIFDEKKIPKFQSKHIESEIFEEKEDLNISTLTIRDLYSIIQNVPCSNKSFLNKLIKENNE